MNWIRFKKFILKNCVVIGLVFLFIFSGISNTNTKVINSRIGNDNTQIDSIAHNRDEGTVLESISENSIELLSPEDRTYQTPMSGYYPASWGFENNVPGMEPSDWFLKPPDGSSFYQVNAEYDGHKNVLEMRKINGFTSVNIKKNFSSSATAGTVEFWLQKDTENTYDATRFLLHNSTGRSLLSFLVDGKDLFRSSFENRILLASDVIAKNTWYHFRVDFDVSQGGWQLQVNGVWYGSGYTFPFDYLTSNHVSEFYVASLHSGDYGNYGAYFDAIGHSWDPDYTIGDNLNEGLLLSYITPVPLNWNGYSLDGGTNVTIPGNTTIPMPSDGSHTIQVYGNDSAGTYYYSEVRSFQVWPLALLSPEDKTYDAPMSGYYAGPYGFENSIVGEVPTGWISNPPDVGFIEVDAELAGHKKVVEIRKGDGSQAGAIGKKFTENVTAGTVEFWLYKDTNSGTDGTRVYIAGEGGSIEIGIENMDLYQGPYTTRVIIGDNIAAINTWHHIRIDVDISQGGYQIYFNGVLYGSGYAYPFYLNPSEFYEFIVATHYAANPNYGSWVDAVGFSWESNYQIGDNLNEGLLLSFNTPTQLNWTGYSLTGASNVTILGNTTIPMPEPGSHTIQVFGNDSAGTSYYSEVRSFQVSFPLLSPEDKTYTSPMSGYYPGSFGFENELHNTEGTDLEFIDEYLPAVPFVNIGVYDDSFGHNKILHIADAISGDHTYGVHYFDNPPTAGTIEFHNLVENIHSPYTGTNYFHLRATDNTIAVEMRINAIGQYLSNVEYYDGSIWQNIADQVSYKWYHHSISFDCEAGVNGQFTWIIIDENKTEVGRVENIEFQNDLNTLDELYLASDDPTYFGATRWDAFGFSWDPNYNIGDNLNEGLLLSYNTTIALVWTGYSLDGGANVTFLGNTTIPMPAPGSHTIQVFGNDSAGTSYFSEVRSFQVWRPIGPIGLSSPEDKTYTSPMSGYYPATFGFENDLIGTEPAGWTTEYDGSGYIETVADLDGHKNVVHIRKNGGSVWTKLQRNYTAPVTSGQVEFWLYKDTETVGDDTFILMRNTLGATGQLRCRFTNGSLYYSYGSLFESTLIAANIYNAYSWFHVSIDFNTAVGWQITIDGVLYGDGYSFPFQNYVTGGALYDILFASKFSGGLTLYGAWIDAIGYSWDPGYNIGDNLNEGLHLTYTYDALKEGHYPATFSFETDLNGAFPEGFVDLAGGPTIERWVVEEFNGHYKVFRGYDGHTGGAWNANYFTNVTEGTVELWMASDTLTNGKYVTFSFHPESIDPMLFGVTLHAGNVLLFDSTGSPGTNIGTYNLNSWQHFRFDFRTNSSTTSYAFLEPNQFKIYHNGTYCGLFDFYAIGDMDRIRMYSGMTPIDFTGYYDAIGYSWDPDYEIGDNFYLGAMSSVNTSTPLTWIGYSLDGNPNVTILGNHTIPMPAPGSHTIQIFGTDYLGNSYRSELRSFQIIPPEPPTISGPSDFSIYYGDPGYSILWSVTDNFPANYTVYRNGTVYDTGDWIDSVLVWLDDIDEGKHNFTCVVENSLGKTSSDEVWINVLPAPPDTTPPTISSPVDITFEEGSIGYTIHWSGFDEHPWWASVWRNGTLIYDQTWIGTDIEISLGGLSKNKYNFTCTLFDEVGFSVSNTVWVTVTEAVDDIEAPTITPPSPVTYEEGSTGNTLTWICSDAHPYAYQIRINGTEFPGHENEPWHGEDITISIDGLPIAIWYFNLTLWDLSRNSTSRGVFVTVIPEAPDVTPPFVSQPADLIVAENMAGTIVWEVSDAHPAHYEILKNGSLVYKQDYWVSGIIQYHFTSLPLGTWQFTLTVWDEAGYSSSRTVIVQVLSGSAYDTLPPEISHIDDQEIEYGTTNNYVVIYLFDEHPQGYSIVIDSTLEVTENDWSNPNIQVKFSLDGLAVGSYTVNLTAWDIFGKTASKTFQVTIQGDITPPTITPLSDIIVSEDTEVDLTWEVSDTSPSHYELINLTTGNIITTDTWSGNEITVQFSDLPIGSHSIRIIVYDTSGNFAMDDVTIEIVKKSRPAPGFELFLVLPMLLLIITFRKIFTSKRRIAK